MYDETQFKKNLKLDSSNKSKELRKKILGITSDYAEETHIKKKFEPGKTLVPVSGKVYDHEEIEMLVSSSLDFWLTADRFNKQFEKEFSEFLNMNFAITTNSGSSANLLAISSLTSRELGDKALKPGDEVLTVAAGFPTTVNPILQNNLIPVFIDVELSTYAVNSEVVENAISENTKAIIFAHTLGNPFEINKINKLAKKHGLWLIEDCCDALGSKFDGKHTGTFGDISTFSFYPAHQITMGEGGALVTNNAILRKNIISFRDWGRDCFCEPGMSNTCGKRFEWELGELPKYYDHKYIYSNVGYNLKITDMQAAIGLAQMKKLPSFIKLRKENFKFLKDSLNEFESFLILPEPTQNSDPCWFGFPITVKQNSLFSKNKLIDYLSSKLIDTRPIFAGNILKQPYFKNQKYKTVGKLTNTDMIMNNSFWIGVYPGLNHEMMDYVVKSFKDFFKNR
jgi:CDP-6-deoxy-D-xylo-4-hexulose-3-dehydrase